MGNALCTLVTLYVSMVGKIVTLAESERDREKKMFYHYCSCHLGQQSGHVLGSILRTMLSSLMGDGGRGGNNHKT